MTPDQSEQREAKYGDGYNWNTMWAQGMGDAWQMQQEAASA